MHHKMNDEMQDCIKACLDTSDVCNQTITHCLSTGGVHAEASHIQLLLDCAEICQTSASFMGRQSIRHADICRICSDICQKCAESCRVFDDKAMSQCAEACLRSAKSCEEMAGTGRQKGKTQEVMSSAHLI